MAHSRNTQKTYGRKKRQEFNLMSITYQIELSGTEGVVDFAIDDTDPDYTYIGYCRPGTAKEKQGWSIIRMTKSEGGNSSKNTGRWANSKDWNLQGNNGIIWNDRATYTYAT
jgi:hypothetical protein